MSDKKYKLFIYLNDDINNYITEKRFNDVDEIQSMLDKYEGFWCRIVDLSTLECILTGVFDDSFLDKEYY